MSGRHPFSELTKNFTPEHRQCVADAKWELLAERPRHEPRRARALTQRDMAKMLKVSQPAVSKLEQRPTCMCQACGRISRRWAADSRSWRSFPKATSLPLISPTWASSRRDFSSKRKH